MWKIAVAQFVVTFLQMSSPGTPATPTVCPVCHSDKLSKDQPIAEIEGNVFLMRFVCDKRTQLLYVDDDRLINASRFGEISDS